VSSTHAIRSLSEPSLRKLTWSIVGRYHGSKLPVIRSQGFVSLSAEALVDLLMDSSRCGEYNKTSIGRADEVVLSYGKDINCPFSGQKKKKLTGVVTKGSVIIDGCAFMDEQSDYEEEKSTSSSRCRHSASAFVGVTKLVRSTHRVPMIKKPLEFTSLLHCRELTDEQGGNGYIIVGRSITPAEDGPSRKGVIKNEILFNVMIIRKLHRTQNGKTRTVAVSESGKTATRKDLRQRCLLITLNHVKSPLIPKLIAKKVGISAAKNFMSE